MSSRRHVSDVTREARVRVARQVDLGLIELLLQFICREGKFGGVAVAEGGAAAPGGAVLVFLPGWDEIMRLRESLENHSTFPASRHLPNPLAPGSLHRSTPCTSPTWHLQHCAD